MLIQNIYRSQNLISQSEKYENTEYKINKNLISNLHIFSFYKNFPNFLLKIPYPCKLQITICFTPCQVMQCSLFHYLRFRWNSVKKLILGQIERIKNFLASWKINILCWMSKFTIKSIILSF